MGRSNKRLEEILEYIFYQNPANQDEIADDLKISRRYVTKLLKPLVDEDIVRKVYVVNLEKYDEVYGGFEHSNKKNFDRFFNKEYFKDNGTAYRKSAGTLL